MYKLRRGQPGGCHAYFHGEICGMTETHDNWIRKQERFDGIFEKGEIFDKWVGRSTCCIYGEEKEFINQTLKAGFDGTQALALGRETAEYLGRAYAVSVSSGMAALHLALKLAAQRVYGNSCGTLMYESYMPGKFAGIGILSGKQVFCPDFTAPASVAPVVYEGGTPIFIDCGEVHWSMDPEALELAFEKYPNVKIVVMTHAYGFPGQVMEILKICREHDAFLIEDCSESLGAEAGQYVPGTERKRKVGSFGDYTVLDFAPGRIITGGAGGMLLTDDRYSAERAAAWADGARIDAPWNQYENLGYGYRMGELTAAVIRGQLKHLDEIIEKKRAIYERYCEKLEGDLAAMIPADEGIRPNYWMSAMVVESNIQFMETRDDRKYIYTDQHGTAAPMEIYDALSAFHAQCMPLYKPMSMQPVFQNCELVTVDGGRRAYRHLYEEDFLVGCHWAREFYERGLCLPSGTDMTEEEQEKVMEIILACYCRRNFKRTVPQNQDLWERSAL